MKKLFLLLLFLAACTPSEDLSIGVLLPLTGDFSDFGEEIVKGIETARQDNINFIFEDTECDSTTTLKAYKKLTEIDNIQFIIGPGCGSPQEVVATAIADQEQLMMIAAAPEVLRERSNNKTYQIQYSLEAESKFMANVIANHHKKVAVVGYQNAFSQAHRESFLAHFEGEAKEYLLQEDASSMKSTITKIRRSKPDALYVTDLTFFLFNGMQKLEEQRVNIPVYSMYVTEIPFARSLVEGVTYSYPGEIDNKKTATFSLAKQSAEIVQEVIIACQGTFTCVQEALDSSPYFDEQGMSTRPILLYKIVNGSTTLLE